MVSKDVNVVNPLGLHDNPASELVKFAKTFKCDIKIKRIKENRIVDAKSVIMLMYGGYKMGDTISVICEGEDEAVACESIVEFITNLKE